MISLASLLINLKNLFILWPWNSLKSEYDQWNRKDLCGNNFLTTAKNEGWRNVSLGHLSTTCWTIINFVECFGWLGNAPHFCVKRSNLKWKKACLSLKLILNVILITLVTFIMPIVQLQVGTFWERLNLQFVLESWVVVIPLILHLYLIYHQIIVRQ